MAPEEVWDPRSCGAECFRQPLGFRAEAMLKVVFYCPWTHDKQECCSLSLLSGMSVHLYANKLISTNNQPLFGFSIRGEYVHCM